MAADTPRDPFDNATFDPSTVASPFDDRDPNAAPDSLYNAYVSTKGPEEPQVAQPARLDVRFADAHQRPVASAARTSDPWTLDADPFGTKTLEYGRRVGAPYTTTDVLSLNVFGREMGAEQLNQTAAGRRLLEIATNNRKGHKRGFLEALTDFSWSDLPFVSLFATVGGSIRDAVTVSDTFRKLQNGEEVSDDELIKTRLYMAENEYRSKGSWGATVGDIIRAAPGFMAEFFVSGGILSAARTGVSKAAGAGIHLGMTRASKVLAREATQHLAETTAAKGGAEAFAKLATNGAKEQIVGKVSTQLFGFMKREAANGMYRGLADDALKEIAENRAKYEFAEMMARHAGGRLANGFASFGQWMKRSVSRGVMDFGAWGTEESTVLFTRHTTAGRALSDAIGTFLVEAPVKGAVMMAPNQFVARPVLGELFGQGGRTVSDAQLSLQQSALMTGNKSLMDNAESIAFGINLLEYVSENTGRGLGSLLSAAGIGLEKAGVKGLVRPASKAVTSTGGLVAESGEEAVAVGGRIRKWITSVFGSREEYAAKMSKDRLNIVARKLGVGEGSDRAALEAALLSGTTDNLRPELRQAIGGNIAKFAETAMDEAYRAGRRDLEYKSYARFAVAKWMNKHQVGPETVMNLYNQMGYDGILGEMFEERYSDVVKGMLGLDDRAEHDFWSNLKEAVKGLYPGWDQLTAEAVGFAMPMVTRMGVLRLQSAVGGGGKIRQIREALSAIDDAMRHDTAVQMTYGQYLATHRLLSRRDAREAAALEGKLKEARAAHDEETAAQIEDELKTLTTVTQRREERHQKFVGSLSEQAVSNVDAIITVPLLSNETLADDEKYARAPLINSDQAAEGLAGQTAIVDFAPELARRMYEAEAPLEGETDSWFRKAAHKVVGLAGALVTGDFSLAATNPMHWTARDMGLSDNVLTALKSGFRATYEQAREDAVHGRIAELVADRGSAGGSAYEVPVEKVMEIAQRRFAERAKQIMAANLAAHQLRSFSDGRMRDQALMHVASTYRDEGDDREYNYAVDKDGNVSFYKLSQDGKSVDESTVVAADEFARRHEREVKRAHDRIVAATVSLLTRGLTKSDDARRRLMASVRMKADSELLDASIYSAAMHMIGQESLVHRVQLDGVTPLAEVMRGRSIGRTNMKVVDYIASKASADEVDARAFESVAQTVGFKFDGTEKGYAERNAKIFRLAKLATTLRREGVEHFSKPVFDDPEAERLSSNGVETLVAKRLDGGAYSVDLGLKDDGSRNEKTFATRDEMVAWMDQNGYRSDTARIVFTQAKVVESADMFRMIRELGLGRQYAEALAGAREKEMHPMLRKGQDGKYLSPKVAAARLAEELAEASRGAHAEKGSKERTTWERLWGENGYMRVGEELLARNGVKKNTVSKYAGEFSEWTPTLYTLSLNSGQLSPRSADVYVAIDPAIDADVTSGVVNALLMNGFRFNARLLKNELRGGVSDFLHQVDAVIEAHIDRAAKAKDAELVESLRSLRRLCTEEVDRCVRGEDGKLRVHRGYGMTAQGFTLMASAFCLYRDREFADSPVLRAVADVADDVRRCPAFFEFLNLTDLVLGGNGFLSEAVRNAQRAGDDPGAQAGVRRLMTYASGDPAAFRKAVRGSLPGGMSYTKFLDVCVRRLTAMSKSGAPLISEEEKAALRVEAEAASLDREEAIRSHFTFLGNIIGTVKGLVDSGKVPQRSFVEFLRDVANDAKADPNNTDEQRSAIDALLGMLTRTATADVQTREYDEAIAKVQTLEEKLASAQERLAEVNVRLAQYEAKRQERNRKARERYAKKHGIAVEDVPADAVRTQPADAKTQAEVAEARTAVAELEAERREAAETVLNAKTPATLARADAKGGRTGVTLEGYSESETDDEVDEDAPAESEDIDTTIGADAGQLDLPDVFAKAVFGAEAGPFTMRKGHILAADEDHLLTRSQARLAVNVCVRSLVATGDGVSESALVRRAKELFPALAGSELEDVVTAFRTADDLRMRRNLQWDRFAEAGRRWNFGDDTKSDEDVSSDDFNDKALGEYNSAEVADFLALAQRSTPETGRNLQGFLRLAKETARAHADDPHAKFLRDVLNPKLDKRATTQALASAYLLQTLDRFDTAEAGEHIKGLLAKTDGQPLSRRGAFLLSYLSSLPSNVRTKFGLLCANSVAATPVHVDRASGILGGAHRRSGGKVAESLVVDSFHRLVGATAADASRLADEIDAAQERLLASGLKGGLERNAAAVAEEIARAFGRESPLYSALCSEMARRQWDSLPESALNALKDSVSAVAYRKGEAPKVRVLSTISAALRVLASYDGKLTRSDVAGVFTAAFAVGDPTAAGLREAPRTARITDPLMTFLSSFQDALPETIMTAEIDQRRETKGSSVAVAPRDLVPMLSRWLYADDKTTMTVKVDGKDVRLMSFAEACRKFYPNVTDEVLRECRQDGTWPDAKRTPICAKCISTSYNTNEIYAACRAAYADESALCYWIPLYAGDHASSTLLQIPREMDFAQAVEEEEEEPKSTLKPAAPKTPESTRVKDHGDGHGAHLTNIYSAWLDGRWKTEKDIRTAPLTMPVPASVPDRVIRKDLAKAELANAFIGFGERGSSTWAYQQEFERLGYANSGLYDEGTVAFVSVNGARGEGKNGESALQQKTYAEAVFAIAHGATLIADGFDYSSSSAYNVGERRLREILTLLGAKSEQVKTDFGSATRWTMDEAARKRVLENPAKALADAAYPQFRAGAKEFAGHEVQWHSEEEMKALGFKSGAGLKAGVLHMCLDALKAKFDAKAWENPERSQRIEGFGERVRTFEDFLQFAALHEVAHTYGRWHRGEAGTAHEDWANRWAIRRMARYVDVKQSSEDGRPRREDYSEIADYAQALHEWKMQPHGESVVRTETVPAPGVVPAEVAGYVAAPRDVQPAKPAQQKKAKPKRPSYEANARAACQAVGLSLMFTDTKRSAVSSLEAQGVGMIGVEDSVDAEGKQVHRQGENRIHIVRNWRDASGKNEAFLGSTFLRGYGARALKRMAQDPRSSTLKAHIISTYGSDLFFAKSLCVATGERDGEFLEGSSGRVMMDHLAKFRGTDELSSDLLTDFDSYKIGPAASKALKVRYGGGEAKIMEAVFDRLFESLAENGAVAKETAKAIREGVATDAQYDELAKAFQSAYGNRLEGDALNALMGDLAVVDRVRGNRKARLSELLEGACVAFVEGANGPTLDLSYREDGAMAYTVANVSHQSGIPQEPGASPRNYEVDALTMAAVLERGGWAGTNSRLMRTVYELVANWGLVANTVYSDPAFVKSVVRTNETIQELLRNGEDPNGQNVRQELARQLWSAIREASNLPLAGIDMPLVSCGASAQGKGVFTHAPSRMQQAMMKGSELFSEDEARFYGCDRRMALCNVNVNSKGFRYGWFLDSAAFASSKWFAENCGVTSATAGRDVATALARAFTLLRDASDKARGKRASAPEAKAVQDIRTAICSVFVDHHGQKITADPKNVAQFGFEDLFVNASDGSAQDVFDLSAVQCEGVDLVHNDATGQEHVFLGGTMFGLPRTPSYNGSMWLQTVRAGLPVTERKVKVRAEDGTESEVYRPGRDAMVSPDPFTNKILGCDHDGDKTKVYMLAVNRFGRSEFSMPPSPSTGTDAATGETLFDVEAFCSNAQSPNPYASDGGTIGARDLYLNRILRQSSGRDGQKGFLQNCWINDETGEEEELRYDDARAGHYFRITDAARQRVSNSFVRALFNMARRLPVGGAAERGNDFDIRPRRSEGAMSPREKFLGGIASSETKAFPVADRNALTGERGPKHVYSEDGNISPEVLKDDGSLGDLGMPRVGSRVSASAADAADARAIAVSMARTLHLAWACGYFHGGDRDMFGATMRGQKAAASWLRFMYHVDGLSNATFDDIKEQLCGRLGWTKDMMDTVVTELLVNAQAGGKLPTTDAEFAKVLGDYSRSIKNRKEFYWMLKACDVTEAADGGEAVPQMVRNMFCAGSKRPLGKQKLLTAFGLGAEETEHGTLYTTKAPAKDVTAMQMLLRGIAESGLPQGVDANRVLGLIHNEVANGQMHNPMIGRLYWIATQAGIRDGQAKLTEAQAKELVDRVKKTGEAYRLATWAAKRATLLGARAFGQSVNYMTADPGDPSAAAKAGRVSEDWQSMQELLSRRTGRPTGADDAQMASWLSRMHAATRLAYDIGDGLQTIAARAVGAAINRRDVLFPKACADGLKNPAVQRIVAKALLRDSVPQYDRLQLEGNAQQIPYIAGYLGAFGSLAADVRDAAFGSAKDFVKGLDAIAAGLRAELGTDGSALEMRHGIESMFSVMYELMVTSSEFNAREGNKAPAYLRAAPDTAYGPRKRVYDDPRTGLPRIAEEDVYGAAGKGLVRIMPLFRANDAESVERIRETFRRVVAGESYTAGRKVQGAEGATVCRDFSFSKNTVFRYAMELAGVRGKDIKAANRANLVAALDAYFGVKEKTDEAEKKASQKGGWGKSAVAQEKSFDREAYAASLRRSTERYAVVLDAWAAAEALEGAFGKDFAVNPATMFGQILPMYSLLTSRTLGAPTPTSPSLLNLLPKSFYAEISAKATAIDRLNPEVVSLLVGTSLAPVSQKNRRKLESDKTLAKRPAEIEPLVKGLDEAAAAQSGDAIAALRADARGGDTEVSEGRENPDYRNTADLLSDGLLDDIADWTGSLGLEAVEPAPETKVSVDSPEWDPRVAKVALAMGTLLGSWAQVEYDGGQVFTIRGKLRGDAGAGKECVIVVDATAKDGGLIDDPKQVTALAKSYGYAQALCAAKDLGSVGGRPFGAADFMRLPLSVREGLVRKYGVGGATLNKVAWSSDGKGLATLVGAIRIPAEQGTRVYHEYFHSMMRMFEQIGLFAEADYAALAKQFGTGRDGKRFDEEKAAEAFRKWVEGNTDAAAEDTRSVFRKIFDFLKGFLEALCSGFSYTGEVSDDTIFKMVVHGIAQPSTEKVAEFKAHLKTVGASMTLSALESADAAKVHQAVRKMFTLGVNDATATEEHLGKMATDQLNAALGSLHGNAQELESVPGFEASTDAKDRKRSDSLRKQLERALDADGHASDAELSKLLCDLAEVRLRMAQDVAVAEPGVAEDAPWFTVAEMDPEEASRRAQERAVEGFEVPPPAPGTPEAVEAEIRDTVRRTVYPQVETNDFYRTADFIATALEEGLREKGSWRLPLQSVIARYSAPTWATAEEEARDKQVVLNGLRRALTTLNPAMAKRLDDKTLRSSLAFEAALRMFQGLERSMVRQTGERGDTGKPMPANLKNDGRATHASLFQVSAWVTSTRPLAPATVAHEARERVAQLLSESRSGASQAELKLHLAMMDKLLDATGDVTRLMDLRYDQGMSILNEVIGTLKAGTKRPEFDERGFMGTIMPIDVNDPSKPLTPDNINTKNPLSAQHLASFLQSWEDPAVQESLKLALTAAYQVAAMAKFYQELDVVPATSEDLVMRNQMMRRHGIPDHVSTAEWLASQAIGDSNLCDMNRGLVDHYDQPYFIANNVDAWLSSLTRKSFGAQGNIGEMLMAENHEYGAIKSRIADLENWYAMLFGMNVEDGGEVLQMLEHVGEYRLEDGAVVRKVGGKYVKFDNYGRRTCRGISMTEADLRVLDLYMKMCSAKASGQDKVVTGVDRLHFERGMERDRSFYDRDKVLARYNDGTPETKMNALEIALVRMTKQLPEHVLSSANGGLGLYDRFVDAALDALAYADAKTASEDAESEGDRRGSAIYNSYAIDRLVRAGLVEGMNRNGERYRKDNLRMYTKAVVVVDCAEIEGHFFNSSEAFRKLRRAGRTATMLASDMVVQDFMDVYSDAVKFVRRHPWLTHGDGQYFNNFGTALPFWRGSGVFMYNANRSLRDRSAEELRNLPREEQTVLNVLSSEKASEKLSALEDGEAFNALELLASRYGVEMRGEPLREAIVRGEFDGTDLSDRTGLRLSGDATLADVARAIYDSYLDEVWRIQSGEPAKGSLRQAERILDIYESTRMTRGEMFGGSVGIDDQTMFRQTGTLPANYQIGHKVHVAIDGITNAMMSRATMANLLMTPAADGAPVYYADPSRFAADTSGLPDEFWKQIARWWGEYNAAVLGKRGYDPAKSGVQNAHDIYEALLAERSRTKGKLTYANSDGKTTRQVKYAELPKDAGDIVSVERWLVREDDGSGDGSSGLNVLGGGEAMGYLKHFVQAGRTLGFGGAATRASLHRVMSWSKSMSVSFSFFFPLATRWESPIGAVGAMATMCSNLKRMGKWARENPKLFAGIQKLFGGNGWITKDFLGFSDILEMMDSNDPFLAELKSWASALGITLSTNLVNPMEPTKSVMASDIRRLKEMIRDKFGATVAAKYGRIMDAMVLRQGDKAFNYALNATKLAVVAQLATKLRHQAQARGKAFDPVRDLRRYSGYINAEIGGIDPLRYAWAHPMNRGLMNTLMFSWQWTRGAWEAGGGNLIEDALFGGHSLTRMEREYLFGRWCRMFGEVMIGVPMLFQATTLALAKLIRAAGNLEPQDGDDDKWWTWENESKTRWTAFDLTPLLKAIEQFDDTKFGGALRRFKREGGAAGSVLGAAGGAALAWRNGGNWLTGMMGGVMGAGVGGMAPSLVPMYTGGDAANQKSRARHYYMHFGKQGWEFFRWFDDAKSQFFSKLSMPTQRILEGVMGRSLGYLDRSLAWEDMGQFERWLSPTTDSALFNLAEAFLPFSVGGVNRNGDAGVLPIFGPVQMGASQTAIQKRLEKAVAAWAHNDRSAYAFGRPTKAKGAARAATAVADILADARTNGFDPKKQLDKAIGQVMCREYDRLFKALPEDPDGPVDAAKIGEIARALNRLGAAKLSALQAVKSRVQDSRRVKWNELPKESRDMYRGVTSGALANPFASRYDY